MQCITCELFSSWENGATEYAAQVAQQFGPLISGFFMAVFALYWAGRIGLWIMGADFEWTATFKDLFLSCVAGTLITFPSIWTGLIDAIMSTSVDLATYLVSLGQVQAGNGLSGLLSAIETPMLRLVKGTLLMAQGSGNILTGYLGVFGSLFLWAIYGVLWFLLVIDAVWFYTKIILIQILGPLIFVCMAIPVTRGIAMQAFRLLLQSILEFATLGVIVGLAGYILQLSLSWMPLADGSVTADGNEFVTTDNYMGALLCGALLIFLRGAFKAIAAQLGNSVADAAPVRQTMSDLTGLVRKLRPTPTPSPKE